MVASRFTWRGCERALTKQTSEISQHRNVTGLRGSRGCHIHMPRACTGRLPVTCLNIPTSMWPSWTLHFQPLCKPVVAAAHKHSTPGRPLSRLPALSLRVLMLRLMGIPKRLQQAPGCAKSSRRRRLHQQPGLRYSQADLRHNKLAGHTQRTSPRVSSLMGQKVWFLMFIGTTSQIHTLLTLPR